MTQILINLKDTQDASSAYNNILRGAGIVALSDITTAATTVTFQETVAPAGSLGTGVNTPLFGYEEQAVEDNWYTSLLSTINIAGAIPAGETLTSIKFFGGAPQATGRSTDITINGVTKTHVANSFGAAPVEWSTAELSGLVLPFDIDWIKTAGANFGYAGVIELNFAASAPTITGPDSTTEGAVTVQTGTLQDTITTQSLISGAYSIAQTIDSATAGTLNYVAESGVNLCTPSTPVAGVPLQPTITAAGITPYVVQQKADDGVNQPATRNITLNPEATHDVIQTMIAVANTIPDQSIFGSTWVTVEDNHQARLPKVVDGVTFTWNDRGEFTTDIDKTVTFQYELFSPASGNWSAIDLTVRGTVILNRTFRVVRARRVIRF